MLFVLAWELNILNARNPIAKLGHSDFLSSVTGCCEMDICYPYALLEYQVRNSLT
jgi:hypothetical protein